MPALEVYGYTALIVSAALTAAVFSVYFLARYAVSLETKKPTVAKANWKLVETVIKEARHLPPLKDGTPGAMAVLLLHMSACNARRDESIKAGDKLALSSWNEAFDLLNGAMMVYASFIQTEH